MKHITTNFFVCLLFLLMCGGTVKAQGEWNYYVTDGTEITSNTGLTSGYYLVSVWGLYNEGLLYWAGENSDGTQFAIKPTTYNDKINKLIDISNRSGEDAKYVWYLDVQENGSTFTIKAVADGSKYPSKNGVSAVAQGNFVTMKSVESSTDADAAVFTIDVTDDTKDDSPILVPLNTGKSHFIVQLANENYSDSNPAYIHAQGTSGSTSAIGDDWRLAYFSGFNRGVVEYNQRVSCAKFAFFKLSEAAAFTYDYKINGTSVKTEEKVVKTGESYPALATMPDFCTATALSGNVAQADHNQTKDITVTWSGPFTFSASTDNAHWYHMKFGNNQRFVVNTGANQRIPLADASATHTTASTEQWAFVGNPFDGFQVYNRRKKDGQYGRLATVAAMTSSGKDNEVTVHYGDLAEGKTDIFDALNKSRAANTISYDNAFMLCTHGTIANKMNWTTGPGVTTQRIAFWTEGSGPNSAFTVQELSLPSLNLIPIGDNTYGTYYIDYPIAVPENVSVYTGDVDLVNKRISMRLANDRIIPAETGVVLVGENNEATACTMTASSEVGTLAKGSLTGSLEATDILGYNDKYLVFGRNSEGQLGFYKPASSLTSIPANKAFITITESLVQGLALNFEGGTHTGINLNDILAPEKQNEGTYYDLSGRRVSKPTKGCYIRNGKKIYIK